MGKLGVSIYPERSTLKKDKEYIDLAKKYRVKKIFTSLLQMKENKEQAISDFKDIVRYANDCGMDVIVDIAPPLFEQLNISYKDLSFFHKIGAYGIRLDQGFTGREEAQMTRNPYGLIIEINMSQGTNYLDNIMSFHPNPETLSGSHNFYPHRYTGLGYEHFLKCINKFKRYNLNTMAFINSKTSTFGPWSANDGMCTLEMHRDLDITTQIKHLILSGGIDDITIANAYASEDELKNASEAFFSQNISIRVNVMDGITEVERKCLFENLHAYRGDCSEYMLRSSMTRIRYKEEQFPAHNTLQIKPGYILIDNELYGQYKGETQIALKEMENDGRVNVVGKVAREDEILLKYLSPWAAFKFIEIR